MKPGSKDKRYKMLITGRELTELKKFTGMMCEAFGLDGRIERYKGTPPTGLYRWDLDCQEMVTRDALDDNAVYPKRSGPGYETMKWLGLRIRELRDRAYAEMDGGPTAPGAPE